MQWHLDRAIVLGPQMDAAHVDDVLVETDGRDPTSMARDILVRLGWLSADPRRDTSLDISPCRS